MSEFPPVARIRENWVRVERRLRSGRANAIALNWMWVAAFVIAGLVLVIVTAILCDARLIAWTALGPPPVRGFFTWITRFGMSDWLLIPSGITVIVVALGDWRRVSRVDAAAWWEIGSFAAVFFVVVAVPGLATDIIKPVVGRFRPDFVTDGAFAFAPFSFGGYAHYSFPSGHATTMGAVAILAAFAPSVITIPIAAVATTIAISRVMIGVHFPSDVVAGGLIGAGIGYLMLRFAAAAGILFVRRPSGAIRARFGALRHLIRRKGGIGRLFAALWSALRGG